MDDRLTLYGSFTSSSSYKRAKADVAWIKVTSVFDPNHTQKAPRTTFRFTCRKQTRPTSRPPLRQPQRVLPKRSW